MNQTGYNMSRACQRIRNTMFHKFRTEPLHAGFVYFRRTRMYHPYTIQSHAWKKLRNFKYSIELWGLNEPNWGQRVDGMSTHPKNNVWQILNWTLACWIRLFLENQDVAPINNSIKGQEKLRHFEYSKELWGLNEPNWVQHVAGMSTHQKKMFDKFWTERLHAGYVYFRRTRMLYPNTIRSQVMKN